jgi:pimeloyl-ACP methyl ester carboxylesterase
MTNLIEEEITFPVPYNDGTHQLRGRIFLPAIPSAEQQKLPPVVFNSGFTGGASMYGQLMGKALAERGYRVMTYDVAGFFKNKDVRNTVRRGDLRVTNVSLEDQKDEVLAAISWTKERFGRMPVVASWAMGSVASLAAVAELARAGGDQVPYYVPMSYTRMSALQNLRADKEAAHATLMELPDDEPVPPFDTGTEATKLGYYPLDPATQAYVDEQLGSYTEADGVERWPGCSAVTAKSYKECLAFDPEARRRIRPLPAGADHPWGGQHAAHARGIGAAAPGLSRAENQGSAADRRHGAWPAVERRERCFSLHDREHRSRNSRADPITRYVS